MAEGKKVFAELGSSGHGAAAGSDAGSMPSSKGKSYTGEHAGRNGNGNGNGNGNIGGNSQINKALQFFSSIEWEALFKNSTAILMLLVFLCLAMLLVPVPAPFLDFFMIVNLLLSLVVMITVINIDSPIGFSTFPTVLLLTTGLRLAVNVSSTRLILSQGVNFEGQVVRSFSDFVTGGSYFIGIVIFIIIITVQFFVITRGASRSSEVAARFKLDALPGKQMAIDADLNAGVINEQESINRRVKIQQEADFYGAMDGAAKFISGEVIASIIIVFINILGGIIIGGFIRAEGIVLAGENYVRFAIGDGLAAAVPSLITAVSSGIIITRSSEQKKIAKNISDQIFTSPLTFFLLGGFTGLIGFIPGFPKAVSFFIAASCMYIGYYIMKQKRTMDTESEIQKEQSKVEQEDEVLSPEKIVQGIQVDPIEIELGYELIVLADVNRGGDLLERVKKSRRQIALELGFVMPQVRITDNMQLKGNEYQIKIHGASVGSAILMLGKLLAIDSSAGNLKLEQEQTTDPVFSLPAYWIDEPQRTLADKKGFTVVDLPTIVSTHLSETVKRFTREILGRKETQALLDVVKKNNPALSAELKSATVKTSYVQKVLRYLLDERVSVRNIETILEVILDYTGEEKAAFSDVVDRVRFSLRRQICSVVADSAKNMNAYVLSKEIEEEILQNLKETSELRFIALAPDAAKKLFSAVFEKIRHMKEKGYQPLIVTDNLLRRPLRDLMARSMSDLVILSAEEVADGYYLNVLGEIS